MRLRRYRRNASRFGSLWKSREDTIRAKIQRSGDKWDILFMVRTPSGAWHLNEFFSSDLEPGDRVTYNELRGNLFGSRQQALDVIRRVIPGVRPLRGLSMDRNIDDGWRYNPDPEDIPEEDIRMLELQDQAEELAGQGMGAAKIAKVLNIKHKQARDWVHSFLVVRREIFDRKILALQKQVKELAEDGVDPQEIANQIGIAENIAREWLE